MVRLATRFLQSMDRAWITTGRRPNGLCGSAILIAARVLGFRRSTSQIVRVAHVCEETIRKRLTEFKHTNIAQLTAAEVKKIEYPNNPLMRSESEQSIEEQMDPPSFTRNFLALEMKQCGQAITDGEAERYQKVLKEKADIITAKLEENNNHQLIPVTTISD